MANAWFRLYAEFATDPKVQMLSESDQRRLVMLFCFRCNSDVTLQDEEVTFLLRISNDEWQQTKALFIARGFIDESNEILNWDKRQFKSDTSKNRVNAYRERKKQESNNDVTLQKRKSNALDTDTEQIQNRTDIKTLSRKNALDDGFDEFWNQYPKKVGKDKALIAWKKKKPKVDVVLKALHWQKQSDQWTKNDGQFIPNPTTYINEGRWQDEPPAERMPF